MRKRTTWLAVLALCLAAPALRAQTAAPTQKPAEDPTDKRAEAYYNFALGHYYAEMYDATSRSEYATQAIEYYKKAYQLDPDADVIREQLAEIYAQSQRIRAAVLEAQDLIQKDPDNLAARRLLARIYIRTLGDLSPSVAQRETAARAADQYREILRIDPGDLEAAQWLARLYRLQNEHDKAEVVLRTALAREPENEALLEQLMQLLLDQGRAGEAIQLVSNVVERSATPTLLDLLGDAYRQTRDFARSEAAFRRAVELDPREANHRRGLAQALVAQDKLEAAAEQYQHLLEHDPDDPDSYLRLAQIYRQLNRLDEAEEMLLQAKQRAPGSLEVIYHEALLYESQGRYDDAIHVLSGAIESVKAQGERGLDTRRTLSVLYEQLGRLYREVEDYAAAQKNFQELGLLGPEEERRSRELVIDTYRASREMDRAIEESEKAQNLYPDDRSFRATHAMLLGEKGETDAAVGILREMLDGTPADRSIYLSLAQVNERGRRYDDAVQAARKAEQMAARPADNEMVWFLLGAIYERQKKFDQAEQYFRKALDVNDRNAAVLNYYGYMLADQGVRLEEAVKMIQLALEQEQNNGAYLDSLGWAYYHMNRLADAEKYLRKAAERSSHDPTIRGHLGDVLYKMGRIELAAAEWERALTEWKRALSTEYEADTVAALEKKLTGLKHRLAQRSGGEVKPQ